MGRWALPYFTGAQLYFTGAETVEYSVYPLYDIIVLAFFAVVGGCKIFLAISEFYEGHPKKLRIAKRFAGNGVKIPSHDTFERVFSLMEPAELEYILMNFITNVFCNMKKAAWIKDPAMRQICVDGKSSNGSGRLKGTPREKKNLQTLHLYDSDRKICIASIPIEEKTNEIPTAQKVLRKMDLSGTVVTFDAMNTQKETIAAVTGRLLCSGPQRQPTVIVRRGETLVFRQGTGNSRERKG
jgi:hypothetical protein